MPSALLVGLGPSASGHTPWFTPGTMRGSPPTRIMAPEAGSWLVSTLESLSFSSLSGTNITVLGERKHE